MNTNINTKELNVRRTATSLNALMFLPLLCLLFTSLSCVDDAEQPCATCPPYIPKILLTLDDIGTTDAWLKLTSTDSSPIESLVVKRGTTTVFTGTVQAADTIVIDRNLLPRNPYTYVAYRIHDSSHIDTSDPLNIFSKDTTSHSFSWTFDTLGSGGNPSTLYDVVIVNDTLAYAVGDIEILDSTNEFVRYNLAIWNGTSWRIKKIGIPQYGSNCFLVSYTPPPLRTIFMFPSGKVIISDGGNMALLNDTGITNYPCLLRSYLNGGIRKIWGTSENNFYCVGRLGTLIHYDNGIWKKLESGTSYDINDIWGAENTRTGEMEILACTGRKGSNQGKQIIRINGDSVAVVTRNELSHQLSGIWFIPGKKYYLVGGTHFSKTNSNDTARWTSDAAQRIAHYYGNGIRGRGLNDVMIVSDYGEILHFNGYSWKNLYDVTGLEDGSYYSVALREHLAIVVGQIGYKAFIAIGRR